MHDGGRARVSPARVDSPQLRHPGRRIPAQVFLLGRRHRVGCKSAGQLNYMIKTLDGGSSRHRRLGSPPPRVLVGEGTAQRPRHARAETGRTAYLPQAHGRDPETLMSESPWRLCADRWRPCARAPRGNLHSMGILPREAPAVGGTLARGAAGAGATHDCDSDNVVGERHPPLDHSGVKAPPYVAKMDDSP